MSIIADICGDTSNTPPVEFEVGDLVSYKINNSDDFKIGEVRDIGVDGLWVNIDSDSYINEYRYVLFKDIFCHYSAITKTVFIDHGWSLNG